MAMTKSSLCSASLSELFAALCTSHIVVTCTLPSKLDTTYGSHSRVSKAAQGRSSAWLQPSLKFVIVNGQVKSFASTLRDLTVVLSKH